MARRKPREETRAEKVIGWIEDWLRVPEGAYAGQPIKLRPWQQDILRQIYDQPTRQAIVTMARKGGKSSLTAMLILVHLVGPESWRRNAQIYSAARSRDQAALVFSLAAKMVRMDEDLNKAVVVRDSAKELFCHLTGIRYKALSADATTAYGLSPVLVIHDELGQVRGPRDELYDALESSMGAQAQPLSIVISTQAPTSADLLSMLIDDAKAGHDPRTRLIMYAAEPDDDPWAEETWRKANPALGDFRSLEEMRREAEKAKRLPSFEASFRNLLLNQRVSAENAAIPRAVWELNSDAPDDGLFSDRPVYAGLDLSARQDLTALVLVVEAPDGTFHIRPEFWTPKGGLRERSLRDRTPYDLWETQGFLQATPGMSVNYGFVAKRLAEIAAQCDLRTLAFDPWRIHDLERELQAIGAELPLVQFGQGYKSMGPAWDEVEALALEGKFRHGNHPVLNMCVSNAIVTRDPAGSRKLDKSKTTGRIDGLVALTMAVGTARRAVFEAPLSAPIALWAG